MMGASTNRVQGWVGSTKPPVPLTLDGLLPGTFADAGPGERAFASCGILDPCQVGRACLIM
jgi:hypothetical protein